jgi:hypothetical protein
MRSTRKNQRKALKALALGFATAAIFATTASAQVRSEAAATSSVETQLANQSTRDGGPVFMSGVPDGYVGSGVEQANVSGEGVTPTNLARAYQPIEQGVARPDGFQPQLQGNEQLVIRGKPDGFQPQTKTVESASVSASSDSLDRGDLALGFGLGLILATACAIALSMTRDRHRTHMAH